MDKERIDKLLRTSTNTKTKLMKIDILNIFRERYDKVALSIEG